MKCRSSIIIEQNFLTLLCYLLTRLCNFSVPCHSSRSLITPAHRLCRCVFFRHQPYLLSVSLHHVDSSYITALVVFCPRLHHALQLCVVIYVPVHCEHFLVSSIYITITITTTIIVTITFSVHFLFSFHFCVVSFSLTSVTDVEITTLDVDFLFLLHALLFFFTLSYLSKLPSLNLL